jgi:hypothetical protein
MCVCVCVCVCIHICPYIHAYICTEIHLALDDVKILVTNDAVLVFISWRRSGAMTSLFRSSTPVWHMHVFMCVCMYIYTHIYAYIYIYIYIYGTVLVFINWRTSGAMTSLRCSSTPVCSCKGICMYANVWSTHIFINPYIT